MIKNHKKFRYQASVEIQLLRTVREDSEKYNIVNVLHAFEFRSHICITFELLGPNLYEVLKLNSFKGLSIGLTRKICTQILVGLSYIKRKDIIHCDLKPENILLKQNDKSNVKLIDFGSACPLNEQVYTYIQSRFYRAPEVILGFPATFAIDMWSFGCILAELCNGDALLQGNSEIEQLKFIVELRGLPPNAIMEQSPRKNYFFNADGTLKDGPSKTVKLQDKMKTKDKVLMDLIDKCLDWDPRTRITPELALGHPWITEAKAYL